MTWNVGDRLSHRDNPDLGPGIVREVDGRNLVVDFPEKGLSLRLAASTGSLAPLTYRPGSRARLLSEGGEVVVTAVTEEGEARLEDGRTVALDDLWPVESGNPLFERLATGRVDPLEAFSLRMETLHLASIREADGLGSFLGGRIRLFPHQLHVAERATRTDPVRWLLADEVGLGKTVEACLILNHLVRTGRVHRSLVVAPETLTVQWLGELWRKYHQVFVLLDEKRLLDVEKEFGPGFNPFDAHDQVVVSLERLRDNPKLTEQAVEAEIDLLIVDEAHHLRRPPGHPGDPSYRAIRPIADLGRHVLLLSATPLEDDAHGFYRLLQLLRPDEFPSSEDFNDRLERGEPLPPCTSATRRTDIGGLPPRQPAPVELPDAEGWAAAAAVESNLREEPATNALERRNKARRLRHALESGAALEAILSKKERPLRDLARRSVEVDPRLEWLAQRAPEWKRAGNRTLVFVARRETLETIREQMSRRCQLRVGVFHEDLSPGQCDIEVAQFRLPTGPSMLVSTECGGEGRNFEFCTRLVLFDLPWNPMTVEQRIGRLDRIGRDRPVEIVYFRPPAGIGATVVSLYESLGLFEHPLGGLERELSGVQSAVEEYAIAAPTELDEFGASRFAAIVDEARSAYDRVERAAYHELHREPYRTELEPEILGRIPEDLEDLAEEVVLSASELLNLRVDSHRDGERYSIEIGQRARVESLPGVPAGASFLGTFQREAAVQDESIDFFASGHPFVEGLMAHLEDSGLGRVGVLQMRGEPGEESLGLLALYRDEQGLQAIAVDLQGRERPDWAEKLSRRPLRSRRLKPDALTGLEGWARLIRTLGQALSDRGRLEAVAAFRVAG